MDTLTQAIRQAIAEEVEAQLRNRPAAAGSPPASDYSPVRLYSVASAAKQLETSVDYVYDRINAGELVVVELGHGRAKQRISATELMRFIASRSSA